MAKGKFPWPFYLYAGHDTSSGVKVSNEPVRRNQIVEDKFAPAREWMKEVQRRNSEDTNRKWIQGLPAGKSALHDKAPTLTVAGW